MIVTAAVVLPGCTSRYRLDFFLVQNEAREKVRIEKTEYARGAVLADPMTRDKIVQGDGDCLMLVTGSRGETIDKDAEDLVSFDRYVRFRLFIELPRDIASGRVDLIDHSFVQLMGRYEVPAEDKMYFPREGALVVDSLADKRLYGTFNGRFENRRGEVVGFEGQFKAKVSR
jgi:hypothetical protein